MPPRKSVGMYLGRLFGSAEVIAVMMGLVSCQPILSVDRVSPTDERNVVVTEKDEGGQVVVPMGKTLIVKLPVRPGTGFSWHVAKNEGGHIQQEGDSWFEPMPNDRQIGGVENQVLRFVTLTRGEEKLVLFYRRPFEPEGKPQRVHAISVQVR